MQRLSLVSTVEKYRLASGNPWYLLLTVNPMQDGELPIYLAHGTNDVTWNGQLYEAYNFDLEVIQEKTGSQLPSVVLNVSNAQRKLGGLLEQYEGLVGATCTIDVVQSLDPDNAILETVFVVVGTVDDADVVTFTLGADNPMQQPVPRFIYLANVCRHVFNTPAMQTRLDPMGLPCSYLGALLTCDKTLEGTNGCNAHSNSIRFGGFPGIQTNGYLAATSAT